MNDDFDTLLRDKLKQNIDVPENFTSIILSSIQKEKIEKINHTQHSLKKLAIAFSLCITCISILVVSAYPGFQFISKPEIGYVTSSLEEAVENGYIQNVDMDYMYFNNIGIKVNYIVMSDYNLDILFDLKFSGELLENVSHIELGNLLIYDENNNLLFCGYNEKLAKKFFDSNNIKYQGSVLDKSYESGYMCEPIETSPLHIKYKYAIRSVKGFPNSKKLYISFDSVSINNNSQANEKGKWAFELNLPEKFYNRISKEYVLCEPNDFIKLKQATVTDTLMQITYIVLNKKAFFMDYYITDSNGKRYNYNIVGSGRTVQNGNEVIITFPLNLSSATEQLIFHIGNDLEFELEVAPE